MASGSQPATHNTAYPPSTTALAGSLERPSVISTLHASSVRPCIAKRHPKSTEALISQLQATRRSRVASNNMPQRISPRECKEPA